MSQSHKISLERNSLRFAAAHMATFGGNLEPLHGHNYALSVEIAGALTADAWVLDFGEAKRLVREICAELDHKFILQARSPLLGVRTTDTEYEISFAGRRYVFPKADVVALDIDNTTAERLAEWAASRLARALADLGIDNVMSISVGVEEMPGQSGWFTLEVATSK